MNTAIRAREANKKDYFYFKKYGAQKKTHSQDLQEPAEKTIDLLIETSLSFGQQYIIWNKNSYFFFFEFLRLNYCKIRRIFEASVVSQYASVCMYFLQERKISRLFSLATKGNRVLKATTEIVEIVVTRIKLPSGLVRDFSD